MKKLSKLVFTLALGFVALGGVSKKAFALAAGNDAAFAGNSGVAKKAGDHGQGNDAAGKSPVNIGEELGWKVFEDSASATVQQVFGQDTSTSSPTCGILHEICIDAGPATGFAIAYDSAGISGLSVGVSQGSISGKVQALTTAQVCNVVNAKFENGLLAALNSTATEAYFLWAPCQRTSK